MTNRWTQSDGARGDAYDRAFDDRAAAGVDVHGEAALVASFGPRRVLDAGCGTGRVAIELARRGISTTGVDADSSMLEQARRRGPGLEWIEADLSTLDLRGEQNRPRSFDIAVLAGNVMIFVEPGTEGQVIARVSAHLETGGLLISGFQLIAGRLDLAAYDRHCRDARLELAGRWSTWEQDAWEAGGGYAVSVHRLTS